MAEEKATFTRHIGDGRYQEVTVLAEIAPGGMPVIYNREWTYLKIQVKPGQKAEFVPSFEIKDYIVRGQGGDGAGFPEEPVPEEKDTGTGGSGDNGTGGGGSGDDGTSD